MFYSLLASLLFLGTTSVYAQPSKSSLSFTRDEYKSKFISDCLQSFPPVDLKSNLVSKSSYCNCFYGKLLTRYGFENLTTMDAILRGSDKNTQIFANIAWSPETTTCRATFN